MEITNMNGLFGIRLVTVLALIIPAFLFSMTASAGKNQSGGSMEKGQSGNAQMWQKHQGKSGTASKSKQGKKQQYQSKSQTRSKKTIRHHMRDDDVYGRKMMSAQELQRYRSRLNATQSDREWAQLRSQHQQQMLQRSNERGLGLKPPVHGQHMLSREERLRYNHRLMTATSDADLNRIRNEHRMMIERRSRELGLEAPPFDED